MKLPELPSESEWVLKAISHPIRQNLLFLILENSVQSYTELMQKLDLSTGKLNFHLKQLSGLIEKQDDGCYILSKIGKEATNILDRISSIGEDKEKAEYLNKIALSKTLKSFQAAPETKKKWFLWISVFYLIGILVPLIIIFSIFDISIIGTIVNQNSSRILIDISILTLGCLILVFLTNLLARKYIETFKYDILDTEVTINKGLIVRKRTVIPFRTITNLVIKQGPIDLMLGISSVIIQTAGESAKAEPEGKLIGVYYAEDFIEEILNLVRLLDPPAYLKEIIPTSGSAKNIKKMYSLILDELQDIHDKLS